MVSVSRVSSLLASAAAIGFLSLGHVSTTEASPDWSESPIQFAQPMETNFTSPEMPIDRFSLSHGVTIDFAGPVEGSAGARGSPELKSLVGHEGGTVEATGLVGVSENRTLGESMKPVEMSVGWQSTTPVRNEPRSRPAPAFSKVSSSGVDHSGSSVFALMKAMSGGVNMLVETAQLAKATVPDFYGDDGNSLIPEWKFFTGSSFVMIALNFVITGLVVALLFSRRGTGRRRRGNLG